MLDNFNKKHAAGEHVGPLPELASYRLLNMMRKLRHADPADRPSLVEVETEIRYGLDEAGHRSATGKAEPWEQELWRKRANPPEPFQG